MLDDRPYLNIHQAADALGVSRRRIWQMVKAGELESVPNPLDRRESLIPHAELERLASFAKRGPTPDPALSLDSSLDSIVASGVLVPVPADIAHYLNAHPDMFRPLVQVCQMTRAAFPPDVQLTLELYRDPEIDDEYLTLYARKRDYDPDFRHSIRAVAEQRFPYTRGLSGRILVTSDFQPPLSTAHGV